MQAFEAVDEKHKFKKAQQSNHQIILCFICRVNDYLTKFVNYYAKKTMLIFYINS